MGLVGEERIAVLNMRAEMCCGGKHVSALILCIEDERDGHNGSQSARGAAGTRHEQLANTVYCFRVYVTLKSGSQVEPSCDNSPCQVMVLPSSLNVPVIRCEKSGENRHIFQTPPAKVI